MHNIGLILLVFAFVFACIAIKIRSVGTWDLLAAAIAFWIASNLIGGLGRVFN